MDDYVMPKKPKPSEKYLELIEAYKHLHEEEDKFRGISILPFAIDIWNIIKFNKCKSIIDYGCGKAIPYDKDRCKEVGLRNPVQELCNIESFDLYDPAYEKYATLPDKKYDHYCTNKQKQHSKTHWDCYKA